MGWLLIYTAQLTIKYVTLAQSHWLALLWQPKGQLGQVSMQARGGESKTTTAPYSSPSSVLLSQDTEKFLHNAVRGKVLPLRIINLVSLTLNVCVSVWVQVWGSVYNHVCVGEYIVFTVSVKQSAIIHTL